MEGQEHVTVVADPGDRRLFLTLPVAIVGVQVVTGGGDLLLASALDQVSAGASTVTTFGWITGVAAVVALLAYPLAGMASDRTPARFGRRSLWVVIGAIGSAVGLLAIGQARVTPALGVAYVAAIGFAPLLVVGLYASIPDRIGTTGRGTIGALVGAATIVGGIAGNLLAARFADRIDVGAVAFAAVILVGAAVFALFGGERRRPGAAAFPVDAVPGPAAAGAPTARRDLAWVSAGRLGIFLGYATMASLAYFTFRDHLGHANPAEGVAAFALASGSATLVAAIAAGPWSDRLDRRKPFVVAAAALMATGLLIPAIQPTVASFLVGGAIVGAGFGVYLAVGTALATLVLPNAETSGRDIGLIGLASAIGLAVAPVLGSNLAATIGYSGMLAVAAGCCLIALVAVVPIRSVR
jgi:MFS family permease